MKKFEYNGIWWLPENPEKQVSGTIYFDFKDGARLELIGSFAELKDLNAFLSPKIILGLTQKGKYITLYKCFEKNRDISFAGLINSIFSVKLVFIGCHFEKEEDILFEKLSISYSNLDEWVGYTGFRIKSKFEQKDSPKKFEIVYESPKKIEAKINKFHLNIFFNFNFKAESRFAIQLKQTTIIQIESDRSVHFRDYMDDIVDHTQDFFGLAIGQAAYPLTIVGKSKASITKLNDGETVFNDILIFYKLGSFADLSKIVYAHEMLFTFRDISDNFELYLKNWFKKSEILKPVYELYFGTLYNPSMYLNHQFLSLIQALESYHRRTYAGKYVSDEDYSKLYEKFINVISQNIDPDFRESLCNKMKYLNELSLRRRLKDLLNKCGNMIEPIISDKDTFIESVKSTRDFLTHYDKNLESKSKKGQELYWLTQRMKFLLEICFLSELGMPDEIIRALIKRNEKYKHIGRQK